MIGRVSAVVLAGLLVAAAAAAPEALARRGSGWGGGRPGSGPCWQQSAPRGDCGCDRSQRRLRDGSCLSDPSQCPKPGDCPGPGGGPGLPGSGPQDGTGKGAPRR